MCFLLLLNLFMRIFCVLKIGFRSIKKEPWPQLGPCVNKSHSFCRASASASADGKRQSFIGRKGVFCVSCHGAQLQVPSGSRLPPSSLSLQLQVPPGSRSLQLQVPPGSRITPRSRSLQAPCQLQVHPAPGPSRLQISPAPGSAVAGRNGPESGAGLEGELKLIYCQP